MSFLSTIGKDVKAVFNWLGSPTGKDVVADAGTVAVAIDPALAGIVGLAESWITKAITLQALGTAAGETAGSDEQKAAAVMTAMGPQVIALFPTATQAQLSNANNAIVAFLDAFGS